MKTKKWKRYLGGALAFLMAASLPGCGKDDEKKGPAENIDKNYVYSYEELTLPVKLDRVSEVFYRNGRIYVIGNSYEDYTKTFLCIMNEDGTDSRVVELGMDSGLDSADTSGEGEAVPDSEPDPEDAGSVDTEEAVQQDEEEAGETDEAATEDVMDDYVGEGNEDFVNIWYNNFTMNSETMLYAVADVSHDYVDESGEYVSESTEYLMCWDGNGELQWSKDLKEVLQIEESYYVNRLLCDNEDTLWINFYNGMATLDAEGNLIKWKEFDEQFDGSLYQDKEGTPFVLCWNEDYTRQSMRMIDKGTLALGNEEEAPDVFEGSYSIMPEGSRYDFILSASTSLYTYNMGDEEPVKFMDTIDSDLNSNNVYNVSLMDDTHFVAVYNDMVDWNSVVAVFTKVPPEQIKDKILITIAGMYLDYDIKGRIIEFNKTNDTYRIQLKEYNTYWTNDDNMAGYTRLNNDIISGMMPDILVVDSNMPFDSYIAKGLIADLYPFLEEDEKLSREDFLPNILDAFSVNGKLYEMVPEFLVQSLVAKTSLLGDRTGWNMQELQEFMDSLPEGTQSFREVGRSEILTSILTITKDEYIDSASGKCSFDSDEFVGLLEFANQFPKEVDYSTWEEEGYWENRESDYRENRVVLMPVYLSRYADFNRTEKGDFGEEITLIGYPSKSGNGSAIQPGKIFALSARSGSQEGAWEFLRYYLTDEYQNQIRYNFPVKKSALQKLEEEATEQPYWENEDGTREYYDDTYYINGVEVKIDPMTEEEAAEFTRFLSGLTMVSEYDQGMRDIVTEEAEAYFEGQKSAGDAASIIQSRMRIYISESR